MVIERQKIRSAASKTSPDARDQAILFDTPGGLTRQAVPTYSNITSIALPKLASGNLDLELRKKTGREPRAALT